jgi:hypothetical protein
MQTEPKFSDPRNSMIDRVARGKTFADVGGLWGISGEKISTAHRAGASALTLIDLYVAGDPAWNQFQDHMRNLGINPDSVQLIPGDFLDYSGESYDVIHSSGVFYHLPNPLQYLERLHRFSRERVVLSSLVTPERIENRFGRFELPGSGALFVPALTEAERQIVNEYWKVPGLLGIGTGSGTPKFTDFATCWWLPTRRVLRKMCEIAGFRIEAQGEFWNGNALTLQLERL